MNNEKLTFLGRTEIKNKSQSNILSFTWGPPSYTSNHQHCHWCSGRLHTNSAGTNFGQTKVPILLWSQLLKCEELPSAMSAEVLSNCDGRFFTFYRLND